MVHTIQSDCGWYLCRRSDYQNRRASSANARLLQRRLERLRFHCRRTVPNPRFGLHTDVGARFEIATRAFCDPVATGTSHCFGALVTGDAQYRCIDRSHLLRLRGCGSLPIC